MNRFYPRYDIPYYPGWYMHRRTVQPKIYPYGLTAPDHDYRRMSWTDYGPQPFVINIANTTRQNTNFRTTLWTGNHLQLTLMHLNVDEDIGLEMHPNVDQFIRIEEGQGIVRMGPRMDQYTFEQPVNAGDIVIIPAGQWHNLRNTGNSPLKLYSLYAPPEHKHGTIHHTKEEAQHD